MKTNITSVRVGAGSPNQDDPRSTVKVQADSPNVPHGTIQQHCIKADLHTQTMAALFGEPIYTYTRAQALADGFQVDVSTTAAEAGIRFPVYLTRGVYDRYVTVPPGVSGQDEAGRLWDVVWMLRFAIIRSRPGQSRLIVALYVRNDDVRSRLVKLVATAGAKDIDDPSPAITVMLPDED